jgi:ribosomal protein S18 acetylase RimI-like enzyme
MNSIEVRPLAKLDLPFVRRWMQGAPEAPSWGDPELAALVNPHDPPTGRIRRAWAAESGGVLVGFAVAAALRTRDAPPECELEFLYVIPAQRRHGIGRVLLSTTIAWAEQLGAAEMWLEVRVSNHAAQRLYESQGYLRRGLRPGYYAGNRGGAGSSEDGLLMRRPIPQPDPTQTAPPPTV